MFTRMSEPRVHRFLLLADIFPEDLIGDAGQDLPTDHAPSESHLEFEASSLMRSQSTPALPTVMAFHGSLMSLSMT